MPLRNRRPWGIAFLAALLLAPATMVEATAAAQTRTGATVRRAAPAVTAAAKKRKSRARRPPPGGVYARSAIVLDPYTDEVLYEKNAARAVPIASITKLMTALVFLEQLPDLSRPAEVTSVELLGGGQTQLLRRERVVLEDLLHMSLMCSDNVATRVLVRESGLEREAFLARMNRKAIELGLTDTRFTEFTGLDQDNVSTAADVARLLRAASDHPLIREISTKTSHAFNTARRHHQIPNTNRLLYNRRMEILGGKTGFISKSGYCLATWVRTEGRDMIAVVLGAPTNATRFADVVRLVQRTLSRPTNAES